MHATNRSLTSSVLSRALVSFGPAKNGRKMQGNTCSGGKLGKLFAKARAVSTAHAHRRGHPAPFLPFSGFLWVLGLPKCAEMASKSDVNASHKFMHFENSEFSAAPLPNRSTLSQILTEWILCLSKPWTARLAGSSPSSPADRRPWCPQRPGTSRKHSA